MANQAVVVLFSICPLHGMCFSKQTPERLRDMLEFEEEERTEVEAIIFNHVTISHTVQANSDSDFGCYPVADDEEGTVVIIAKCDDHAAQLFYKHHSKGK